MLPGAAIVIGQLYGRTSAEEDSLPARAITSSYRERFLEMVGYTKCEDLRELAGYGTEEKPCRGLVAEAAVLLLDVLRDAPRIIESASEEG